jgi:integrase
MRLFKPKYRNQKGQLVNVANWWIEYTNHDRRACRLPGFGDRKGTEELGRQILRLVAAKFAGGRLEPDLARWVEGLPMEFKKKLARHGLLEAERIAAVKPLAGHLDDWKAALLAKGNSDRHAELVVSRARKAFSACRFKFHGDISASKLQKYLGDLRDDLKDAKGNVKRGISAQTFNFYQQACKQFCRWMLKDGRAWMNPLEHLSALNVRTDRRHDRRALSTDELRWLLDVTENGSTKVTPDGTWKMIAPVTDRFRMTAKDRVMLYRLAVETGLRAAELRSLTRSSFVLDGEEPSVTIAAAYAKNRREDTLPLRPATAALLAKHLEHKMPAAQAFNVPTRGHVAKMLRADLDSARQAWLEAAQTPQERHQREQTSFCSYRDDAGLVADFHALRHTFISNLAAGGVHPKTAQQLARHSTITLTMDRYSHTMREGLATALNMLPVLPHGERQAQSKTGTDDVPTPIKGQTHLAAYLADVSTKVGKKRSREAEADAGRDDDPSGAKNLGKTGDLTKSDGVSTIIKQRRRGGGAAERAGFENRYGVTPIGSSNLPLSAFRDERPFNQSIERLSCCYAKTYALQDQVQTDEIQQPPLHRKIRSKP